MVARLLGNANGILSVGVALVGVVIIVAGIFLVVQGWSAKNEVRAAMLDEAVTTTIDGEEVLVLDQRTAMNQADLIKSHTNETFGPYTSLSRDDPQRDTYLKGLTLRNSLTLARMGLDLSELVMGVGGLFFAVGGSVFLVGALMAVGIVRPSEVEAKAQTAARQEFARAGFVRTSTVVSGGSEED